jgi:hypothetical protein
MDKNEIINIVKNIKNNKIEYSIYNHILNDMYMNKINPCDMIFADIDFILSINGALLDIDVYILNRYFIYFQHSKQKYYNIFSKTFHKFDKIKYIIYYKKNICLMCYCNYHEKLKKYFYKSIDKEIAIDILKSNNIYTTKVISIHLISFLEYNNKFVSLNDICDYIKLEFEIKN